MSEGNIKLLAAGDILEPGKRRGEYGLYRGKSSPTSISHGWLRLTDISAKMFTENKLQKQY